MKFIKQHIVLLLPLLLFACQKQETVQKPPVVPLSFYHTQIIIDGQISPRYLCSTIQPTIQVVFSDPIDTSTLHQNFRIWDGNSNPIPCKYTCSHHDSIVSIQPINELKYATKYGFTILAGLISKSGKYYAPALTKTISTPYDTSDKFKRIADDALLDLIQRKTFSYFWDFAHPVSGLARERNTSGDIVTMGGSGFGIMAIPVGVNRGFITREQAQDRLLKILRFLRGATTFHGAFPHWMNGNTGNVIPFSTYDNGADLVETSYLMQGLLTARQFFNQPIEKEDSIRSIIQTIWEGVEWNWFRKNNEQTLYWHWSPNFNWYMNMPIRGYDECLITYILAASSSSDSIPSSVYHLGWAQNGSIKNGASYYGYTLPLGSAYGGPLFFEQYTYLGVDPHGLTDMYANYWTQVRNHTLINRAYCISNPKGYACYSSDCWGLTASDNNISGYSAHEPNNDLGIIAPTAAISSLPYTPDESMQAIRYFYYKMGDKLFRDYGFTDAFNPTDIWFADSYLAIDQGPIILMIENYRSGLLWDLFMSCPEVKQGMKRLGFTSPRL